MIISHILACTEERAAPLALQQAASHAWHSRWWLSIVSVAAQRAFVTSLLRRSQTEVAMETPELLDVLFPHAEPLDFGHLLSS